MDLCLYQAVSLRLAELFVELELNEYLNANLECIILFKFTKVI